MKRTQVGVIGSAGPEEYPVCQPDDLMYEAAEKLGCQLSKANCIVVSGGKGGVMEAVCKGAKQAGGFTVAEIDGSGRFGSNKFVDVEIVNTDVGFRGPSLLVGMSDVVISLGGGAGTLQELAVAYRMQKPVVLLVGFGGWTDRIAKLKWLDERQLIKFKQASSAPEAVTLALSLIQSKEGK